MKTDIVIVDANNLAWAAFYTMGNLSSGDARTGVVFGFLKRVLAYAKQFDCGRFFFCFDSNPENSRRREIYPEYKAKRGLDLSPEDVRMRRICREQVDQLRKEVLPAMGFGNVFWKDGYEADDLMAALCYKLPVFKTVVSGDEDLLQLLGYTTQIFSPTTKKLVTWQDFVSERGLDPPYRWAEVKAIAGCGSDNVEGIPLVGEVKAIRFIKGELPVGKIKDRITSPVGRTIIARNRLLVHLPFGVPRPQYHGSRGWPLYWDVKEGKDSLDKRKFVKVFDRYGFLSFLREEGFGRWERYFLKR